LKQIEGKESALRYVVPIKFDRSSDFGVPHSLLTCIRSKTDPPVSRSKVVHRTMPSSAPPPTPTLSAQSASRIRSSSAALLLSPPPLHVRKPGMRARRWRFETPRTRSWSSSLKPRR
jgi:hypothetical protein